VDQCQGEEQAMSEWISMMGEVAGLAGLAGVTAAGLVDTLGKAVTPGGRGLPMRGFRAVERVIDHAAPVLRLALGEQYRQTLAEAYRDGRRSGDAPALLKLAIGQGLDRLEDSGTALVDDMARSIGLPVEPGARDTADQTRMALETETDAVFLLAESEYRTTARLLAGAVALLLSFGVWITLPADMRAEIPLVQAILTGLVAVPLAPVAKDIAKAIEGLRGGVVKGG